MSAVDAEARLVAFDPHVGARRSRGGRMSASATSAIPKPDARRRIPTVPLATPDARPDQHEVMADGFSAAEVALSPESQLP